jgi:hypothetical protein
MTPARLLKLVTRAINGKPSLLQLDTWGAVLACPPDAGCDPTGCVHDDEADKALVAHYANSSYPATAADIRKIAVGLANTRVDQAMAEQRRREAEQGVPPGPEWQAARLAFEQAQARKARDLDPAVDDEERRRQVREAARAAIDAEHAQQTERSNA